MLKKLSLLIIFIAIVLVTQNRLAFCEENYKQIDLAPKLSFEKPDYDFGEIFRGENTHLQI